MFRTEILIDEKIPVGIFSFVRKYIGFVPNNAYNDPKALVPRIVYQYYLCHDNLSLFTY